jgi:hypothetical protein
MAGGHGKGLARALSTHHVYWKWSQLAGLAAVMAILYVAAGVGMAYVAGFSAVQRRLEHAQWWWLAPSFAALLLAFCGYFFAYRGMKSVEDGARIETASLLAVVAAAFSGFLAYGATALDEFAMRAGGSDKREAIVRVGALTEFEQAVLAMIVCPASIAALVLAVHFPRPDFTWPWAVIPPPALVLGLWLVERYRSRFRGRHGWRRRLGMFLDSAHLVGSALRRPRRHGVAVAGMALFWGAEMFAVWAATAAFGFHMSALMVIVGVGTAMIFTRRTAPLAGAGLMLLALVPTLWYGSGVPFAAATLGVAAYRFLTMWTLLPAALAAVPRLRRLGRAAGELATDGGPRAGQVQPALEP